MGSGLVWAGERCRRQPWLAQARPHRLCADPTPANPLLTSLLRLLFIYFSFFFFVFFFGGGVDAKAKRMCWRRVKGMRNDMGNDMT